MMWDPSPLLVRRLFVRLLPYQPKLHYVYSHSPLRGHCTQWKGATDPPCPLKVYLTKPELHFLSSTLKPFRELFASTNQPFPRWRPGCFLMTLMQSIFDKIPFHLPPSFFGLHSGCSPTRVERTVCLSSLVRGAFTWWLKEWKKEIAE